MAKKTYSITQIVEMTAGWTVRAENADEANDIATERTRKLLDALRQTRKNIDFGDINDEFLPARDEVEVDEETKGFIDR